MILRLEKPEGRYIKYFDGQDVHFAIDCSCGGKDGKRHGCRYEHASGGFIEAGKEADMDHGILKPAEAAEHTLYINDDLLLDQLYVMHNGSRGQPPLVIICNDCGRRFPLTHGSYLDIDTEMKADWNRGLLERQKRGGE